jgi:hypothetical protein
MDLSEALWRKSMRSTNGADCVEVVGHGRTVAVRDSKNPKTGNLAFRDRAWGAFARQVKAGAHDLP